MSQVAATAALNGGLDHVHQMARVFAQRARQVTEGLSEIASIRVQPPHGSFYCLPDFSRIIESTSGVENDQQMADWLLDELGVAMVPGSAFNAPGFMRLSFAANEETLDKGLNRLKQAFG